MFVKVIIYSTLNRIGFLRWEPGPSSPVIFRQVNDYFSHIEDEVQRSSFDGRSRRGTGAALG